MKDKILLLIIIQLVYFSCNTTNDRKNLFFPSQKTFKKGIVYKYYYSNYSKKTKSTTTDVQYNYLKMINDSVFSDVLYNSAFHIVKSNLYEQKETVVKEIKEIVYLKNGDSILVIYQGNNEYLTFGTDTVYSSSKISKNDFYRTQEQFSYVVKDSIVNSEPAKIVNRTINSIVYNKGIPQDTSRLDIREIYIKDFGLWRSNSEDAERKNELMLVEQILPEKFEELAAHTINRVGYIDFEQAIDNDEDLELCFSHQMINDYYNGGQNRSGYIGGKGNLKKYVNSKLDSTKLKGQSGYLGFRFVINCKGKAGKFVTNEAGFDYQKKNFPKETIAHLYDIVSNIKQWSPCIIRGEERDSYAYITFILKNGKIEDILP